MRYQAPGTIDEAVAVLAAANGGAKVLAGGTDLLVQLRAGMIGPDVIVDIKRIPELRAIAVENGGFRIGAAVAGAEMGEHAALKASWPGVVEAMELIGSTQIQGRATPGGNLCNASPAADGVPPLIALGATAVVAGPGGERRLPAEEFATGPSQNVLGTGEILVSLEIPAPQPSSGARFLRFIPRNEMDIAVVNVASALRFEDETVAEARVVVGAAAPTALLVEEAAQALVGQPLTDETIAGAAAAARAAVRPIDDMRGSVKQRRHLAGVLTERTLRDAARRARGEEVVSHP